VSEKKYLDFLAKFGISSAHPGGFPLTQAMLKGVSFSKNHRVLDVGCGTGETSVYLAKTYGCHVVAVDLHPMMIAHAKNRIIENGVDVELIQANAEELPFEDNSFDIVLAESVTVFTKIDKSISEYHRLLKPGGLLLDIEMTSERPLTQDETKEIASVYEIERVLTNVDWVDAFHGAGFTDIVGYHGLDFLNDPTDLPNASGFEFTESIDLDAFYAWLSHIQIMDKYRGLLSFRIYKARA
jgi:SAM-dependent methyltransferase